METQVRLQLPEIERRIGDIASRQLGIDRVQVLPTSRFIEDLNCDSLEIVELMMNVEDAFSVTIPNDSPNPVCKSVFTRQPFRISDLAEVVYLQQGTGKPERQGWRRRIVSTPAAPPVPFSQLNGVWNGRFPGQDSLFEAIPTEGSVHQFRRRSDGMRCLLAPSADVEIGSNSPQSLADETPLHIVGLDSFLIDAEPVSTTAYCRFLNSIDADGEHLFDWVLLDPKDDRREQMLIEQADGQWQPRTGVEQWPMVLVSWYGANAYSLWANGCDWWEYREHDDFLPTEVQWEYAARGRSFSEFPWGDSPAEDGMICARHERGEAYQAAEMPMAAVHEPFGMSPFGLHHMGGNIWQWCRDWYEEQFYRQPEATGKNPVNRRTSGVRSERGGSWVGPAELCRSSCRRGRPPSARGRCLGFRCVSPPERLSSLK